MLASQAFPPRSRNTHSTQPRLSLPLCLKIAEDVQVGAVRTALGSLVERIEVRAEALPGQPRPGARLILRGNLVGALQLVHGNVKRAGSPGGICTLLTFRLPPRVIPMHGHRSSAIAYDAQRRGVIGA